MKLICISSRVSSFAPGEVFKMYEGNKLDGNHTCGWIINHNEESGKYEITGSDGVYAEFSRVKSLLKMLVRAHVVYARSHGWGDGKNGAYKSWSQTPYKSANDWARCFALGYDLDEVKRELLADYEGLDQDAVNCFVEEQMSYF